MRKILVGVLSVAGLLAVVLALASSPASAAKDVVTVTTPTNAGEYTVSWSTKGGCDPGAGTSGASGSVTLTVAESSPGSGTGTATETGIVIETDCTYEWKATYTNAAGVACAVTGTGTDGAIAVADTGTLALTAGTCVSTGKFAVTVRGSGTQIGDCIKVTPTETVPNTADDCDVDDADDDNTLTTGVDAGTRLAVAADNKNVTATSATTFTITATPEKVNGKVPDGCNAVSEDTEKDYADDELQKATLEVTDVALGGAACTYTVTAALPAGFAAGDGSLRSTANLKKEQNPDATSNGPDGDAGSNCGTATATDACADNGTIVVPDLTVSIGTVKVFLVQNVIGDAGGANAKYTYEATCGVSGLPGALTSTTSGGISTVAQHNVVELRAGRYNISAALPGGTATDGVQSMTLDAKGKACEGTIAVTGAPSSCSVSSNSPASLATHGESVIIEVTVDCTPPPEPEPEPPADDGGDMMDGGDDGGDMMGDGDDGGDMMDDGDDGDGPMMDAPTG